jgi:hypothetical protein
MTGTENNVYAPVFRQRIGSLIPHDLQRPIEDRATREGSHIVFTSTAISRANMKPNLDPPD